MGAHEEQEAASSFSEKSLAMIAAARIVCPKINIASTTALQAINPPAASMDSVSANVLTQQLRPLPPKLSPLRRKTGLDENDLETRRTWSAKSNPSVAVSPKINGAIPSASTTPSSRCARRNIKPFSAGRIAFPGLAKISRIGTAALI